MKPRVYVETSVISYLVSRPSRDLIVAANQQITRDWWETRRAEFERICRSQGYEPPVICTPQELLEEQ